MTIEPLSIKCLLVKMEKCSTHRPVEHSQNGTHDSERRSAPASSVSQHSDTTMGFRQAGVLAPVGFFLGIAFSRNLMPLVLTRTCS